MSALERINGRIKQWLLELDSAKAVAMAENLTQGKMLRSKLILSIADESEASIVLCSVVELIQSASLLHDDVIDESCMRRGNPSLNATFGNKNSIMLGDIFYSKAFFELTSLPLAVAKSISRAVVRLSCGELLDVELSSSFNTEESRYLEMIGNKTSSLIEASAESAAILAGKESEPFRIYGRNLGIAFQIIDDILDITQDSRTLGKPALHDFAEGKATLPYIYLYHSLKEAERARLEACFGRELESEEREWIKDQMRLHHCVAKSHALAKTLGQEALLQVQENERLGTIMREMIERDF